MQKAKNEQDSISETATIQSKSKTDKVRRKRSQTVDMQIKEINTENSI